MSVINQMLQDLDKRRGRSGGEAAGGDAVRSVQPGSTSRSTHRAALVIFGLALLMLAAGLWLRQRNAVAAATLAVVPAPPVVALANDTPHGPSPIQPVVPPAPVMAASEPLAVAKPRAASVAPPRVSSGASEPIGHASVATTPVKFVASVPAAPVAPASASITSDPVEAPPPSKTATAANLKAAGGKTYSAEQVSANLLAEALKLDQQGHLEEAKVPLERLLAADPLNVRARQMLVQLQLDTGHGEQARQLLAEGQRLRPEQSDFTLALARLQVESGDVAGATRLLEAVPAGARDDPQIRAFLAALLLRAGRTDEAVQHYLVALRSDPSNASWLVGVGVALEGVGNRGDAAQAYRRAESSSSLTPELANFLSERLAQLRR